MTIPGYIQNIISSLSQKNPQKMQEIVITNKERILEIYAKNIDDDSIRQILFSLLTINYDLVKGSDEYDYNKNLKDKYFTTCISIIDKLLSKYTLKYFNETNESFNKIYNEDKEDFDKNKILLINQLYDSKFKIKNIFILILKFLKFVELAYHHRIDDILLRIFQNENLKVIENILFRINSSDISSNLNVAQVYLYEEFLFFFSYFLMICLNKKNCNKEYLLNNFFIDDYEKIYNNQVKPVEIKEENKTNNETKQDGSQESIEGKVLSTGENASGKIDNLYSCSFNLEEKLNDSSKLFILNFYFDNFNNFYYLVKSIKNLFYRLKGDNQVNRFNSINKQLSNSLNMKDAVITSSFIYFLDFLIVLFDQNKKEFSMKNIAIQERFPKEFFWDLLDDIIVYKSNQFIQNKILRIFELLIIEENEENREILRSLIQNNVINSTFVKKIIGNIDFQKKKLLKLSQENTNYPWLIKMAKLLLSLINLSNEEKLELFNEIQNKLVNPNSPFLMELSKKKFDLITIYIETYLSIIGSDLLINEQQSISDLKNNGDEEIIWKVIHSCLPQRKLLKIRRN